MSRTRYYAMPCSFFTEPPTAGLPPLAACLLLRARAESLIGVLTRSPRILGAAHGRTAAEVEEAIADLVARDLVAWWPDHELLVEVGGALRAQGSASKAATAQVESLPAFARPAALRAPGAPPSTQGDNGGPDPTNTLHATRNSHTQDQVLTHPAAESKPKRSRARRGDTDPLAQRVIDLVVRLRGELGLDPLIASDLTDRAIVARLRDKVPVADLLRIVELRAEVIRRGGPRGKKASAYFDCVAPFTVPRGNATTSGWTISRSMLDEDRSNNPEHVGERWNLDTWTPPGGKHRDELDDGPYSDEPT